MDYRFEDVRLQSFEGWPSEHARPADLAAAGFYFTKKIDKVRCFECSTEICCWEQGDDPMTEHMRWGGRCRFIRKLSCGNVPIGANADMIPKPRPRIGDVCGLYRMNYRPGAEADTYVSYRGSRHTTATPRRPDFPDYDSYEARLLTYIECPSTLFSQMKEQLADAGFFYRGTGDLTTCYHCGGGLKNWEFKDNPWVQHAKWFSTCDYVRMVKGQEFINNVNGNHATLLSKVEKRPLPSGVEQVEKRTNSVECTVPMQRTNAESQTPKPQQLSEKKSIDDARVCKICYIEELGVVFLPCGHITSCVKCASSMTTCGICRQPFSMTVRVFFS